MDDMMGRALRGTEDRQSRALGSDFIDLFCGCGGFTLGMLRAGFRCRAAIDFDARAINTLRENLVETKRDGLPPIDHVLQEDLTQYAPETLAELIGKDRVDVIVGGPPCQGFSKARQRDGANHGRRLTEDSRRYLYREFLKYVEFFRPRIFVMENVPQLRSAADGEFLTRIQQKARELGYRVHSQEENAWELGVPQKRCRLLIIGTRIDLPAYFVPELQPAPRACPHTPLGAAICDLPPLRAGDGEVTRDYDLSLRRAHVAEYGKRYLHEVLQVELAPCLRNHIARFHSDRDLRDFRKLPEGQNSAAAMRNGVEFEFPYDKQNFKDRYTRQTRSGPCSTIVAHLGRDGLMFIHPTQNRSLTPREAARIQSFPDWFIFPQELTHSFRQIGNAVPPLVGEAVGLAVRRWLTALPASSAITRDKPLLVCAAQRVEYLAELNMRKLRDVSPRKFLEGWQSLLFLVAELHPVNAKDHGQAEIEWSECANLLPGIVPIERKCYARSGWPVVLKLVGKEAWRRFESGQIMPDQFYRARVTVE